jgi:hypothetical protein
MVVHRKQGVDTMPSTARKTHDIEPIVISIEDARIALGGMSRQTVYNLINAGKLQTTTIGARRLVLYSSIRALVAANIDQRAV